MLLRKKPSSVEHPQLELLGIDSAQNRKLKAHLKEALQELALDIPVVEISEIEKLLQYDISGIPSLAINGRVLFQQLVPSVEELKRIIFEALNTDIKATAMKKILVPTDFSAPADHALDYALAIANQTGASITLLHAYKIYSTAGMFVSIESYMQDDAGPDLSKRLKQIEPQLRNGARVEARSVNGEPIVAIADVAEAGNYDLIVMGTKGAGGLKEVFVGSITHGVIRATQKAVLAIPEGARFNPIKTIVMAVDSERISSSAVTSALVNLSRAFQAKIKIFHKDTGETDHGIDASIDRALELVEHSFHYELDNSGNTIKSIDQFVADTEADMLCLVRRKRNIMDEIFHSSITTKEAFHSVVPLLILRD